MEEQTHALARAALAVLDGNRIGDATKPSPRLYPHQWSWDSACVAMGLAAVDQARAEGELLALFAGQWRNGLLPHIVFADGVGGYFPGPDVWQTERSPDAPARPRTSGIVQPPIHATAAWRIYRRAADRERAAGFLRALLPRLAAWHDYLHRERTRDGEPLVEIWHPWESGMDNAPLWDDALARIALRPRDVPPYRRVDVTVADAAERPSDFEYDRYVHLVSLFRSLGYRPEAIRDATPFALQPVLFNALLVQSERDLAEIARVAGADPRPFEERAERTAAAVDARLWDERDGIYRDRDVRAAAPVAARSGAAFAPLHAGIPTAERAAALVASLAAAGVSLGPGRLAVPSLPLDDPRFDESLYWRGPLWPILAWVLASGLARYGHADEAAAARADVLALARDGGFWEHYSPLDGRGHGGEQFSWTAGLVLDLLFDQSGADATGSAAPPAAAGA